MPKKFLASLAASLLFMSSSPMSAQESKPEAGGLPPAVLGEVTGSQGASDGEKKTEPQSTSEAAATPPSASAQPKVEEKGEVKLEREKPAADVRRPVQTSAPAAKKPPVLLFGRIEEIASKAEPSFPIVLKALTPKMDQRPLLQGEASAGTLAGNVVKSYPTDFRGTWGGKLQMLQMQFDPVCYQIDPEEARRTQEVLHVGSQGTANFTFNTDAGGQITSEPTQIVFMVPYNKSYSATLTNQMLGSQASAYGPMAGMVQGMLGNMQVPIMMNFGNWQTGGFVTGVSGNQARSVLLSNRIKQLAPGVLEQQVISSQTNQVKSTGKIYYTYDENVFRYTQRGPNQLYVEIASVTYGQDRRFQKKMVLAGYVNRGAVQQDMSNPYTQLQQMLGPNSPLQVQPGGGGMPSLPPGFNPFQSIFGQ